MKRPRRIAVVTGSRAEYGLLRPVMIAVRDHPDLELEVLISGEHLLPPARTAREVTMDFEAYIGATIPMHPARTNGRAAEATALGRGISGLADHLAGGPPEVVVVLGDRIEAFAAAAAAAVAGVRVAHLHGGDRAPGIADEGMRHAITKLAHIHLPATATSAQRIIAMGEEPDRVHVVGSPAIDGLGAIEPMSDERFEQLGRPQIVLLLHPEGGSADEEYDRARRLLGVAQGVGRVLALAPNHDPGREGIVRAIEASSCPSCVHLPRPEFIGLLRRAEVLVGNSSAGLIECAAIPLRCVNTGPRQAGREMGANVIDIGTWDDEAIDAAIRRARTEPLPATDHPYGPGHSGPQAAAVLAGFDPRLHALVKRNTY